MGELDNTYIVFASDNGYMFGNYGLQPVGPTAAPRVDAVMWWRCR